jgi:hypothetical protein
MTITRQGSVSCICFAQPACAIGYLSVAVCCASSSHPLGSWTLVFQVFFLLRLYSPPPSTIYLSTSTFSAILELYAMSTSYRLTAVSAGSTSASMGSSSQHSSSALSGPGSTMQNTSSQQQQVPPPSVHFPTHQAAVGSQPATAHIPPPISPPQPLPPAKSSASPWLAMARALGQASAASWFGACALVITIVFAIVMYEMAAWTVGNDYRQTCMDEPEINRTLECNTTLAHPPPPPPFVKVTTIEGMDETSIDWTALMGFPQIVPMLAMHVVIGIATLLPSIWEGSSRITTHLERILWYEAFYALVFAPLYGAGFRSGRITESGDIFALHECSGWVSIYKTDPQTITGFLEQPLLRVRTASIWSVVLQIVPGMVLVSVIATYSRKFDHVFHTIYHQNPRDPTDPSDTARLFNLVDTGQASFAVIALCCAPPWLSLITIAYLCSLLFLKTRCSDLHIFNSGFAALSMSSYVTYASAWTPAVLGTMVHLPFMQSINREDRFVNMLLTQIGVMSLLTHSLVFALYCRRRQRLSISGITAV